MSAATMRAVVLEGPGVCAVQEVPRPVATPGEAVVDAVLGALVEPGGNALRAEQATGAGDGDPRPLVGATVGLDQVGAVLAGEHPVGPGPKVHVDPRS